MRVKAKKRKIERKDTFISEISSNKNKLVDPFAWIIFKIPSQFRMKAQIVVEELAKVFTWDNVKGELKYKDKNQRLINSNIVHIVHHAVHSRTKEPDGYSKVFPFLVKGSTKPNPSSAS